MGNLGGGEILVILLVALIVLGPTKLPPAIRQVGKMVGEIRRIGQGFQQELREAAQPLQETRDTLKEAGTELREATKKPIEEMKETLQEADKEWREATKKPADSAEAKSLMAGDEADTATAGADQGSEPALDEPESSPESPTDESGSGAGAAA